MAYYPVGPSGAALQMTYGTGVPHDKEIIVPVDDIIHTVDPPQNPALVLLKSLGSQTIDVTQFGWLEGENYERRTFTASFVKKVASGGHRVLGIRLNPKDWNAISYMPSEEDTGAAPAANNVMLEVSNKQAGPTPGSAATKFLIRGFIKRQAYELGRQPRKMYGVPSGGGAEVDVGETFYNTIQLTKNANSEANFESYTNYGADLYIDSSTVWDCGGTGVGWDYINDGDPAYCQVYVNISPLQGSRGYKQGSMPGKEVRKHAIYQHQWVQIEKDSLSLSRTAQTQRTIGDMHKLPYLRNQMLRSHASKLEACILFQGGGVEGIGGDWGMVEGGDNPRTVMKGLGIGHAASKEGWITTWNGNPARGDVLAAPGQVTINDYDTWINLIGNLYNDWTNGSNERVMLCSQWVKQNLMRMALSETGPFRLQDVPWDAKSLGLVGVDRIVTPAGSVDAMVHPHLNGPYQRYALILDPKNIQWLPFEGADSILKMDIGGGMLDGYAEQVITEFTIKVMHEWTHAIVYVNDAVA